MKKKLILILASVGSIVILGLLLIVPVCMILDFFGANITDGYVENNSLYSDEYKKVLNKYVKNTSGYVSLERILYFYLEDTSLTFDEIYSDNLDNDTKRMLPISEVCLLDKYKILDVCKENNLSESEQIDEEVKKPFAPPLDFTSSTVTSFFKEERVIYGEYNIHSAWDLANSAQTPVYAVCDGTVEKVNFPYLMNSIDKSGGAGNSITISCAIDDITYTILYGHLFPKSTTLQVGDTVTKGNEIASVGTTGYSTGNHLHFQVSLNGSTIDGMSLVDFSYETEVHTPEYDFNRPTVPSLRN